MKNLIKLSILVLAICLSSCTTEPLIEEFPQGEIINIEGFNIGVSGTFKGEAFNLQHNSWIESNYPVPGTATGTSPQSYISRIARKVEFNDVVPQDELIVGISANVAEGDLLDTAFIGEHDWRDLATVGMTPGLVFLGELKFKGDRYWTTFNPNENDFNTFEITKVTKIDNDENLDEKYFDKLFMIEGKLQCLFSAAGDNDYSDELIIDHFSLIFINE